MLENASLSEIKALIDQYQVFAVLSHIRPDGDAIGSQLALGDAQEKLGKKVYYFNEDGLPESMAFMKGSERIEQPPTEAPADLEVAVALDTAKRDRVGKRNVGILDAAKVVLNIDHHITNPGYGDLNYIVGTSPACGEILYDILKELDLPLSDITRDAIYVAVSTDTGSFQYGSTTKHTYEMAADLVERGVQVGEINRLCYDSYPARKVELMKALFETFEISADKKIAHWDLTQETFKELDLQPDDSEDLINIIRGIDTVVVAMFFEELEDGEIRVSMRSKTSAISASEICQLFGGGGHSAAAGIRKPGTIASVKVEVVAEVAKRIAEAGL